MADPMPPPVDFRAFAAELGDIKAQLRELQQPTGTQQAQAVRRLRETIEAMPVQDMGVERVGGIALTAGWVTYATVTIAVPEYAKTAKVLGIGSIAAWDATTGGVTTCSGRVLIQGNASAAFPASKDAAATRVNNVITATHARTFDVSNLTTITIQVQANPLNASAFKADSNNFAQIAAMATFTRG